jgi:hypothetical protein
LVPLIPEQWEYLRWLSVPEEWKGDPREGVEFHTLPELEHIDPAHRIYGQDVGLLAGAEDEIRKAFAPSDRAMELLADQRFDWYRDLCAEGEVVALSARRGDIVDLPDYQPVVSIDYYRRALDLFPDAPVVAFSDEPEWVASVLAPQLDRPIRVLSGSPARPHGRAYLSTPAMDWVDLQLSAMAPHHIIANSTYQYWGAFLSNDLHPVYPSRWHGPSRSAIDVSLMFPPEWVMVSV